MARFVTFNGSTMFHPGALSKVDVSTVAQTNPGLSGIIGIIGEADNGEPAVPHFLYDPTLAKTIFGSGDLADAIRLAFEPANDARVPGGANQVIVIKTNVSTQSTATFMGQTILGTNLDNQIVFTSRGYGADTIKISWAFEVDPISSNKYQATIEHDGTGLAEVISDIGGNPLMNVAFKGPEDHVVVATGTTDNPGPAPDVYTILDTGTIAGTEPYIGKWVRITSAGATLGEYRKITAIAANFLTVSGGVGAAGFSALVPDGATYEVIEKRVWEGVITASSNTAPNATVTLHASDVLLDAAGTASMADTMIRVLDGNGIGQIRTVKSVAGSGAGPLVLTLADNDLFDTAPINGDSIAWIDVIDVIGKITGSNGYAINLETEVTWGDSVTVPLVDPDLDITLSSTVTVADLVSLINSDLAVPGSPAAGGNYLAEVGAGRSGIDSGSSQLFDFDTKNNGTVANTVDLRADFNLDLEDRARFLDDLNQLLVAVNAYSSLVSAVRAVSGATAANVGAGVPVLINPSAHSYLTGGVAGASTNTTWQAAFDEMLKWRRDYVIPLISEDAGTVSLDAIHAQLLSHVQTSRGDGKNECVGLASCKFTGSTALDNILIKAAALNDPDTLMTYQSPTNLDVDSNLKEFEPWGHAVIAAGMAAGLVIGVPITFKYLKATGVENNSTYADPLDKTTSTRLLKGGVLFSEEKKGKGYRWVRGLTTHTRDDNLAYTDLSVRVILNFISYDLRTDIEDTFTGTVGNPGNIADIKSRVTAKCESYRTSGYIVDSKDPVTGETRHAFYNVTVNLCGDIADIRVSLFFASGINFETLSISAQLPVLSA